MIIEKKQDWKIKGVQLAYVLGLSLIIAAIIYFFASNWPGFDKWMKIELSVGLIVFFYIVSFFLGKFVKRHPFLGDLFLFLGCMSFGVGVALLGQIYNSHADSYMLFVVWSIPALLFSFFTKYQPFYVLSYGLLHIALWFFLFPSSGFHYVPESITKWVFLATAIVNGILYLATDRGYLKSKSLQYLSFTMMHLILLGLTMEELFDGFNIFISLAYIALSIGLYRYLLKNDLNKKYLIILGLSSIAFVIIKFVELIGYIDSEFIFLFTIFIPFILVGLVIFGLRKWKQQQKEETQSFFKKVVVGITTAIASIIAGSSLFGISVLFFDDISFTFFVFFAIALILLAKRMGNWDSVIRYTLLFTAYFIGIPSTFETNNWIPILFIGALLYVFWKFSSTGIRNVTYLGMMIVLIGYTNELNYSFELVVGTILFINLVIHIASPKLVSNEKVRELLVNNSLFYGLFSFFYLTFLFENEPIPYYLTNGSYFVLTTLFVMLTLRRNHTLHYRMFLSFWFAYIVYKYYDLVWELLHKSVTFLITGVLIILIANRLDKAREYMSSNSNRRTNKFVAAVIAVILVQLAILGVQIGKSERLLANGDLIKLELAPVDPRSLLQGDYLILRYSAISTLKLDDESWNERVIVGLQENANGVYEYSGHFVKGKIVPEDMKKKADVWITGKFKGYENIEYGIENYFVPEGTGLELQEKMKYAYIRVAENGDALLVEVSED